MTHGVHITNTRTANRPTLKAMPQSISTNLYQPPDKQDTSTSAQKTISQRRTPTMPEPTSGRHVGQLKAIADAFQMAATGRKQAALANSQFQSLIYRIPALVPDLRRAAMEWLCGLDLTDHGGSEQAASQAIIKRLNEGIDGHSRVLAATILEKADIERLRVFRHKVRELVKDSAK